MGSKMKLKKVSIIGGIMVTSIILLIVTIYIIFKSMEPSIKYSYFINGIASDMVGTYLSNYECNNNVTLTFDSKNKSISHSELIKKTKCNLYFQDTIGSYIYNYVYAHSKEDYVYTDLSDVITFTGENPNNYVYFNCDNYNDGSTCELWRILEIKKLFIDGDYIYQTKLIRNDKLIVNNIQKFVWTSKNDAQEFYTSKIGRMLNDGYYNGNDNYEYLDNDNTIVNLDFSQVGLKNDLTRTMLLDKAFKINSEYTNYSSADGWYKNEANGTSIDALIGLPTISDYALSKMDECGNMLIFNYKLCQEKSYMDKDENIWLLNYYIENNNTYPFYLEEGYIGSLNPDFSYAIYPTLYLNQKVMYNGGNGSKDTPYIIKLEESN